MYVLPIECKQFIVWKINYIYIYIYIKALSDVYFSVQFKRFCSLQKDKTS